MGCPTRPSQGSTPPKRPGAASGTGRSRELPSLPRAGTAPLDPLGRRRRTPSRRSQTRTHVVGPWGPGGHRGAAGSCPQGTLAGRLTQDRRPAAPHSRSGWRPLSAVPALLRCTGSSHPAPPVARSTTSDTGEPVEQRRPARWPRRTTGEMPLVIRLRRRQAAWPCSQPSRPRTGWCSHALRWIG